MNIDHPLSLLGGLTPAQFMKRHWQKKPLLVRQAIPNFTACVGRAQLQALAEREDVESRLIVRHDAGWKMKHGPLPKSSLPPRAQKNWTFLVQGVDQLDEGVHQLMQQFRFVPDARLDDVMISYASDGGGVGPHFDSYDVFLLQAHGTRRWRIGRQKDLRLQEGVPLKILQNFEPEQEFELHPGDMLYLPPRYAHDGIAQGECMTWSIGFRAPQAGELARELLQGLADEALDQVGETLYRDPGQQPQAEAAAMPAQLLAFAQQAVRKAQNDPHLLALLLGEYLTQPKANVWFEADPASASAPRRKSAVFSAVQLDLRTRMLYDQRHVFINGEGFRVSGSDAKLLRQLANERRLTAQACAKLSPQARDVLRDWLDAGWLKNVKPQD